MADVGPALVAAWTQLADQLPLVRSQFASQLGRELHHRRWEAKRDAMAESLHSLGLDPTSEAAQRLMGTADVLTSSTALLELHDKAGVAPERAAEWCAWATAVLLEATMDEVAR